MSDHAEVATATDGHRSGRHRLRIEKPPTQAVDGRIGPLRLHEDHLCDGAMPHLPNIGGAMSAMDGDHVAPISLPV